VARRSGVPASTLRFYEEKGLIASIGRSGLRRVFDPGVLERLAMIALGRASGFSLDEIARMFTPKGRPHIDRQMLASKADEVDRSIRKLTAIRDGLRHAAVCRAPSHAECPSFNGCYGRPRRRGSRAESGRPQERSNSRVSRVSPDNRLLSSVMMASANARFDFCNSITFSSTVSRAIRRYAKTCRDWPMRWARSMA
jgi:DNA-binding transcriptional MerR regulator